jgi:hypothetical protein
MLASRSFRALSAAAAAEHRSFDDGGGGVAWMLARLRLTRWRWPGLLAAVAAVGLFLLLRPAPRFGEEQFQRLREGMSEAEVAAVLGCPSGDYRPAIWSRPDWFVSPSDPIGFLRAERGRSLQELDLLERQDVEDWVRAGRPVPPSPARVQRRRWWARGYGIDVAFDEHGRAIHVSLWELDPPRPPPDMLRWVRWCIGW